MRKIFLTKKILCLYGGSTLCLFKIYCQFLASIPICPFCLLNYKINAQLGIWCLQIFCNTLQTLFLFLSPKLSNNTPKTMFKMCKNIQINHWATIFTFLCIQLVLLQFYIFDRINLRAFYDIDQLQLCLVPDCTNI